MRLVVGGTAVIRATESIHTGIPPAPIILNLLAVGDGLLLVSGLWTPVAGPLLAVLIVWSAAAGYVSISPTILTVTIGVSLALVGPGAWSMDAWLFGWKRIKIED